MRSHKARATSGRAPVWALVALLGASTLASIVPPDGAAAATGSATFTVVARSGTTVNVGDTTRTLTGFGRRPSINDFGTVAFVGKHSSGEGLFVGASNELRSINPSWSANSLRNFGDAAVVNNRSRVLARDRFSGSPPSTFLRIWQGCDAVLLPSGSCQADAYDLIAKGGATLSNADFDAVLGPPSLNNNNQAAFAALEGSTTYLVTGKTPTFQTVPVQPPIRPLISDHGSVIFKAGNGPGDPIRLYNPGLAGFEDIACPSGCRHPGFFALGRSPGISDDGRIVTFVGDLSADGALLAGLDPGPGVFMSVSFGGGAILRRLAGVSGNGFLDPGEQLDDANGNGAVDPGEDAGRFSAFDGNARVAVNNTHVTQRAVTTLFMAVDLDGNKGLEVNRVQMKVTPGAFPPAISDVVPGAPLPIVSVGQDVPGLGTVTDLDVGDPLNNKGTGDMVFWASTASASGIVKVNHACGLDVEYRDPDASTYVNQYAAGLASDVEQPPPWLHPNLVEASDGKRGGNACGPSSLTMLVNEHKRQRPGDPGDRVNLDSAYQKTICEFKTVNGKGVCTALEGPPEDGKNYAFSSAQAQTYLDKQLGYKQAVLADAKTLAELVGFIDSRLDQGVPLLVSTTFGGSAWGKFGGGHMIEFVGRTPSGDYIVNDPAGDWFSSRTGHYNKASCGNGAIYDKNVVRQHLVKRNGDKQPVDAKGKVVTDIEQAQPRWALAVPYNAAADPDYVLLRAHFDGADPEYAMVLTDAQGRRAGWLPDGTQVTEIPGSQTLSEQFLPSDPDLPEDAPAPNNTAHVIVVEEPSASLTLKVQGAASMPFVVEGLRYVQGDKAGQFTTSGAVGPDGTASVPLPFSGPQFSLTLTPASATNPTGTPHTVTATLTDTAAGAPVAGATLGFTVTGANTTSGTGTTDGAGQATFTYTGTSSGTDTISATYDDNGDGAAEATAAATKEWVNSPPNCSTVVASPATLWPPNHKLVAVSLSGGTDPDGDPVTITVTGVTQDEALNGLGDGDTAPDAQVGAAPNQVLLRAERSGTGDGRIYRIAYTASDGHGGTCSGTVTVGVAHDQGQGATAVDSGLVVNSFGS